MKLFHFYILLFLSPCVFSQEFQISSFNDSWGGGTGEVYDDLRSYGFELRYKTPKNIIFKTTFSNLTNRKDANIEQQKSLDELILSASFPVFQNFKSDKYEIRLKGGVLTTGSIFGKELQSITHSLFGVEQTNLAYSNEKGVYPHLGYSISKNIYQKEILNKHLLKVSLKNSIDYIPNFKNVIKFNLPVSLNGKYSKIVFSTNYIISENFIKGNNLLENTVNAESGLNFNFKVYGKYFFYYFENYATSQFSSGGFGFRFAKKSKKSNSENYLFKVEPSMLNNGYGFNFKYLFAESSLWKRRTHLIINHNFNTLLKKFIPSSPDVNGHANQLTFGGEIEILEQKKKRRIITPYTNISIGNKSIHIYSKNIDLEKTISNHFVINNDLGIKVRKAIRFKSKVSAINFQLYYRSTLLKSLTPKKESNLVSLDDNPYQKFQTAIGLGIQFKI